MTWVTEWRFEKKDPGSVSFMETEPGVSLLACDRIGNSQRIAPFGTTAAQHLAAIFCGHSLAEAMLVDTATVGGLERSFHFFI